MKMINAKLIGLVMIAEVTEEVLDIVVKEHPEIVCKAMLKVVDKNPEYFKDLLEYLQEEKE